MLAAASGVTPYVSGKSGSPASDSKRGLSSNLSTVFARLRILRIVVTRSVSFWTSTARSVMRANSKRAGLNQLRSCNRDRDDDLSLGQASPRSIDCRCQFISQFPRALEALFVVGTKLRRNPCSATMRRSSSSNREQTSLPSGVYIRFRIRSAWPHSISQSG